MTKLRKGAELVVVGGGIVGCAVAREAALRGLEVVVVERDTPGRGATWAAGGMLSPYGEADRPGPFLELGLTSLRLYPDFVRSVEEESGRSVGYLESGKLELALDEADEEDLREHFEWLAGRGDPVEWLDARAVREREPLLTGDVRAGLLLKSEGQVDNRLLGPAVAEAARVAGARIRSGIRVRGLLRHGDALEGIELDGEERIFAPRVLVAAGAWSGGLEGLPRRLPVRPVRGQMLALDAPDPGLHTVIASEGAYLIPRRDGPVIVGSTMEEAGFRTESTAEAVAGLLDSAMEVAPALAGAPLLETWAGLRPGTPDDLPILGRDPLMRGLFYATGHFRNGILLAPVTAACLLPLLTGEGRPPVELDSFRPDRFGSAG